MITTPPLPTEVLARPIRGQGLQPSGTLGSLLDQGSDPILLVFLRHHG